MRRSLKWIAKMPLAPVIAAMFGLIALTLIFMTPVWLLERLVAAGGLPALIPAAQPPLGSTARILCGISGGFGVFVLLWAVLTPLQTMVRKRRPQKARGSRIGVAPVAPHIPTTKRPPIFAERELGAPFMSDEAIAGAGESIAVPMASSQTDDAKLPTIALAPAAVDNRSAATPGDDKVTRLADEMARLEAALVKREARGDFARPRAATDPVQLRNVLHHMG